MSPPPSAAIGAATADVAVERPAVVERQRAGFGGEGAVAARTTRPWLLPARDAAVAGGALAVAIAVGSGGFAHLDPALLGYLAATFVSFVATVYRASAFWRRPASAFYARALATSLRRPRSLRATLAHAGSDLAAQSFIRRRSWLRWSAHLLLSLGTVASFAITVPLVFGWMHFTAAADGEYSVVLFTVPTLRISVDGAIAWLLFHGLSLAGGAVAVGAVIFLALRFRLRRLPGATASFAIAPLILLLFVAATGLALPATRGMPGAFAVAAALHQAAVIALLVAIPFSKLGHVLIRPLQLGARAVRADGEARTRCACGAVLAPARQHAAVTELLAERGFRFGAHPDRCPACRRRRVAAAQAALLGAAFQPRLPGARPSARAREEAA